MDLSEFELKVLNAKNCLELRLIGGLKFEIYLDGIIIKLVTR